MRRSVHTALLAILASWSCALLFADEAEQGGAFATGQYHIDKYGNHYSLDGKCLSENRSTGHIAMNAVASLAATNPRSGEFVAALWNAPVSRGQWRYYDGMLYMMAPLHCGGEFRIWAP